MWELSAHHHQLPSPVRFRALWLPCWYSRRIQTITKALLPPSALFAGNKSGFAYPVITLPATKWPKLKAEHCKAAPIIMIEEPRNMVLRRPRMSPIQMVVIAPEKHPRLYDATEIPAASMSCCNRTWIDMSPCLTFLGCLSDDSSAIVKIRLALQA